MSSRVDYDAIAHLYDDRRRDHVADEGLTAYMAERGLAPERARVLDVGCGTGKQLAANRGRYPRMLLAGVDRSGAMLRLAQARDTRVAWIHGDAQALPFASGVFDYATNQFSYPHIADKQRFAGEVFRVLRPGGRFALTNIDPWAMPQWILYRYFPEARDLDEGDFLPPDALRSLLASAGFARIEVSSLDRSHDQDLTEALRSASQRHSASQLMAIPDAAYRAGLDRLGVDLARGVSATRSQFVVLTVRADKPLEPLDG
jgi:SAM-dependent methyltransferase